MEELDFQGLLDKFNTNGFQKGEQIILANFGTNQTLLSLIFQTPVNVRDIQVTQDGGVITRDINLVAGEKVVGHATSHIPRSRNRQDVWEDIAAGRLGLGQIVVVHNLPNKRVLVDVGRDDSAFWRTYTIEGQDVFLEIHEHFLRQPFIDVGWLTEKEG